MASENVQKISIQGYEFTWREGQGLETEAVLAIQNWIIRLAGRFFERSNGKCCEIEDLIQAGTLGALSAARTYRPDTNCGYMTWASKRIIDEMRKMCIGHPTVSLDADVAINGLGDAMPNDSWRPGNVPVDDGRITQEVEARIEVQRLLPLLRDDEQRLLVQYYGLMGTKPKTLRALGKAEGITDAGVKKRIGKAIEKLRKSQLQG